MKEEHEKAGLKLNVQKIKIMTSCPTTSRQMDGENVETVAGFIFLASIINVECDCSQEIKTHLLLGRIAMTNLDSVLKKQRHHFADKSPYSQSYCLFQ